MTGSSWVPSCIFRQLLLGPTRQPPGSRSYSVFSAHSGQPTPPFCPPVMVHFMCQLDRLPRATGRALSGSIWEGVSRGGEHVNQGLPEREQLSASQSLVGLDRTSDRGKVKSL